MPIKLKLAEQYISALKRRIDQLEKELASLKQSDEAECDHSGEWDHYYDEDSTLGDYYHCADCGELTQVG